MESFYIYRDTKIKMASIFTKIINGEIPSYKVAETDEFLAFLDVNPNAIGHTLCIPKIEKDKLFDLDKNTYSKLMEFSRQVAIALEKSVPCKRIGVSVIGLEVPHTHVHLIPLNSMEDVRFINKVKLDDEAFKTLAKRINSNLT